MDSELGGSASCVIGALSAISGPTPTQIVAHSLRLTMSAVHEWDLCFFFLRFFNIFTMKKKTEIWTNFGDEKPSFDQFLSRTKQFGHDINSLTLPRNILMYVNLLKKTLIFLVI